jgi:nucleoside-diphosphate-sugar epimerase
MERLTRAANGLVLRLGHLYGPGSIYAADGTFMGQIRAGKVPLVGAGRSTFSFTHSHDAASAIVAALDKGVTGALNIVDDKPEQVSVWLPAVAEMLGAKPPKQVPAGIARLAVGDWGVAFMTQLRGADNSRARLTLDWRPRYPSWRAGFAELVTAGS